MSDAASGQPEAGKTNHIADRTEERQPWELYMLVGGLIGQTALVLLGNQPYVSAWLLALLALGVGQGLLLPSTAAWFGALATVVLWVLFRQAIGIWSSGVLVQSMLEVVGLALNIVLAIRHRQIWRRQQLELQELRVLRQVLVVGEAGTGMLPREVAELRLREEIDRARLFRR
ncbi:MAG: hypothetical protein M3R61_12600, partial [Chloroflexota bacterium]|nr:hypothetical protein [Chloroflexota bacterium]